METLVEQDERLTWRLMDFAVGRLGFHWVEEALAVYLAPLETGVEHVALFLAWALHHWRPEAGRTLNEAFLTRHRDSLAVEDRAWLRSQAAARLSYWEVREVLPAAGVKVKDLLGDETRFIHLEPAARRVPVRSTWLARVVEHEGLSLYRGMYAGYLRQPQVDSMVRATREALREVSGRDEQLLRLIRTWTGYATPAAGMQPC
jgi:hypothetical protein